MKVSEFTSDQLKSQIPTNEGIINAIQSSAAFSFDSNCHSLINSLNNDIKLVDYSNNLAFSCVSNEQLEEECILLFVGCVSHPEF